jgi:hypothetical protein
MRRILVFSLRAVAAAPLLIAVAGLALAAVALSPLLIISVVLALMAKLVESR